MLSPFEELEYLSDYLPDEGEAVVVSRKSGELVCEPLQQESLREGITDPRLYGLLVHANERLNSLGAIPIWTTAMLFIWSCVCIASVGWLTWSNWFLVPGLALILLPSCIGWIRYRQHMLFRHEIRPLLDGVLCARRIHPHALLGAVRQHEELRTLMDELVRRTLPIRDVPLHPEL